jgi:hypothetical protein
MYIDSDLVIQAPQTGEDIEVMPFSGYCQKNTVAIRSDYLVRRGMEVSSDLASHINRIKPCL